jgi:glycerophosphoryl diester phosphodiesterase
MIPEQISAIRGRGVCLAFVVALILGLSSCDMREAREPWAPPAFDLQGHRGARGLLPENTVPSFLRALDLGVTTLELDVVISKDRQVVVSHEPWFSSVICTRPDGSVIPEEEERGYNLFELTYDEIAAFDCGSRAHPGFPRQERMRVSKPLLHEVINAAEGHATERGLAPVRYNVEIKSHPQGDGLYHPLPGEFARLVYDVIAETGVLGRSNLQAFDVRSLQAVRSIDPNVPLALLIGPEDDLGLDGNLARLGFQPEIYSPHYGLVDLDLVREAQRRGMQVIPWTVNTTDEMRSLVKLGVDGIITDYPDLAVDLR